MIRIAPPPPGLVLPPLPKSVLAVGDHMAVAEAGGMVRIDLYGQVHGGNRVAALIAPADAKRLATQLAMLASKLGP